MTEDDVSENPLFRDVATTVWSRETVRDKDGISAAVAMLGMIAEARASGRTVGNLLAEFDETFGAFASDQISLRVSDLSLIGRMMSALRAAPPAAIMLATSMNFSRGDPSRAAAIKRVVGASEVMATAYRPKK